MQSMGADASVGKCGGGALASTAVPTERAGLMLLYCTRHFGASDANSIQPDLTETADLLTHITKQLECGLQPQLNPRAQKAPGDFALFQFLLSSVLASFLGRLFRTGGEQGPEAPNLPFVT